MGTRARPVDRGRRRGRDLARAIGVEHRRARESAGLSLRAVARTLGVSHSRVGRFERGELRDASIQFAATACAVVGLELAVRAYPAGDPIRDRAQLALLDRFRLRVHPSLRWRTEVPVADGDLRAWDAELAGSTWRLRIDAETKITDGQSMIRRLTLKVRDSGPGRVVLLVADTRTNREAMRLLRGHLRDMLPLDTRTVLAALREGRDPGGSGIVIL